MVVILQPASRRPFSMLPVIIFTVMMNNCQQDAKSSYFLPISFVVEFANGFKMGGGKKNSNTKNTKSSLLVPSLYIQAQQHGKTD